MTPEQILNQTIEMMGTNKVKGIVAVIVGDTVQFRFVGLGGGEISDRLVDIRQAILKDLK